MSSLDNLSPEKRALIDKWVKRGSSPNLASLSKIPVQSGTGPWPLSFSQQRFWLIDQLVPTISSAYNIVALCKRLQGVLNVEAFKQALTEIMRRHEVLRTTFTVLDEHPIQNILGYGKIPLETIDLQECPQIDRENRLQKMVSDKIQLTFDLSDGLLWRVFLFQLAKTDFVVLVVMHHSITDDWSCGIFRNELVTLYGAYYRGQLPILREIPIQYKDYVIWQREQLQHDKLKKQLDYWKNQLKDVTPILELRTDHSNSALETSQGAKHTVIFSILLCEQLKKLGQQKGCTLSMVLLAAFQVLLFRYTGQNDFCIGTSVAGRSSIELEELIGCFINTLALRANFSGNPSFLELLTRVRETVLDAYENQDLPFDEVVAGLQQKRDVNNTPLFQVMITFLNTPKTISQFEDIVEIPFDIVDHRSAMFNITLYLEEIPAGLKCTVDYDTGLFDKATIVRLLEHFQVLLDGVVNHSTESILKLPLLTQAEHQQILGEWNNTKTEFYETKCIHKLFEEQVERTPNAVAVVFEEQELTYRQLDERANQLACYLQKLNVELDTVIGICMERSLEMVISILGILKTGRAYLPLDPTYPPERLTYMLSDTNMSILLTHSKLLFLLPPKHNIKLVMLDRDWEEIIGQPTMPPNIALNKDLLAYVIYTSGSTGKPKGIMIPHKAIVNHMRWMQDSFPLAPDDSVLQKTPFSFDASVWEFYAPLLVGARLVMARPDGHRDMAYLCKLIIAQKISILQLVPSMLHVLLEEPDFKHCVSLKRVFCGGEALLSNLAENFFARLNAELINLYGPTETTIDATSYLCTLPIKQQSIPIGRPVNNTNAYVLDRVLSPVPIGVIGELYLSGAGLARGYLGHPSLTADAFIPNPFLGHDGERMYRTGDLARWLPDGNIDYLGRADQQVKIRGFRIELGEIEQVLIQHPNLRQGVVIAQKDTSGDKRLVAYVLAHNTRVPSASELRNFLAEKLPEYMLPSVFMFLDVLPLTPNGKLDRKALPSLTHNKAVTKQIYIAPRTPSEVKLTQIWSHILNIKQVGIFDNFFELGGDSLLALRSINKARQIGLSLTLKQLFEHQTIAELAFFVIDADQSAIGVLPLTPSQARFLSSNLFFTHDVVTVFFEMQWMEPTMFETVVRYLNTYHDGLRARFIKNNSNWQQIIAASDDASPFVHIDLSNIPAHEHESNIESITQGLQSDFNIEQGNLWRVAFFDLGKKQPCYIFIAAHHIVSDVISLSIIQNDFQIACQQLNTGNAIQLPTKGTTLRQWCKALEVYACSIEFRQKVNAYWLKLPWDEAPLIPLDFPENRDTFLWDSLRFINISLNGDDTAILRKEMLEIFKTNFNTVLLLAFAQAMTSWTMQPYQLMSVNDTGRRPFFNSDHLDASRLVSWLSTDYLFLLEKMGTDIKSLTLQTIDEQLCRIPLNGLNLGMLYNSDKGDIIAQLEKDRASKALILNYVGELGDGISDNPDLWHKVPNSLSNSYSFGQKIPNLLECRIYILDNCLNVDWIYSLSLYQTNTIERVVQNFAEILHSFASIVRNNVIKPQ